MMNRTVATFALALGVAIAVVGCEQSDPSTTPSASSPPAGATATETAASDAAKSTANDVSAAAGKAADSASSAANSAANAAGTAATDASAAAQTAASGAGATTQPAGAMPAEAQKLMDQTLQYIKENKMDLAEKGLTQLESMKSSIPAAYHPKIDQVRTAFNAAKSGGASLQGLLPGGTAAPAAPATPAAPK